MTTVSKSFTAAGLGQQLLVRHGESFDYALSGTFTATVRLERTTNGGLSWDLLLTATAAASGRITAELPDRSTANYRWRCSAYTNGTAVTSMATVAPVLQTIKNSEGAVVAQITGDGMTITGALAVTGTVDIDTVVTNDSGAGTANGATVTAVEYGDGVNHKTVLTLTATPITVTDEAGVAQAGGVKIYDFPAGLIQTEGAVIDAAVTLGVTGTMTDTWAGGVALGTATATTGATLVSTEADIMPEVDVAAATAKVAVIDAVSVAAVLTESGGRWLDGTTTAKDLYINLVVDDEATHTTGTGTISGTITIHWKNLGDK